MTAIRQLSSPEIHAALSDLTAQLAASCNDAKPLVVIGIANGGIPFARKIAAGLGETLGREVPVGTVDITLHRDDLLSNPIPEEKPRTSLPFAIDGATIILADDVIQSGRTIRAALNEIFDLGRPDRVLLTVLADRGLRKLPIQPDFTGLSLDTTEAQKVKVSLDTENPEKDTLEILHL